MARSLRQVEAFFRGIDDQLTYNIKADENAQKKKKADQDFLFAQSDQDLKLAQEGRRILEFDSLAAARANKLAADTEAGQFSFDAAGVRRRANTGKITEATTNLDGLDATAPQRAANILATMQNQADADKVQQEQLANRIGLIAANPKALDYGYRAQQAEIAASGGDIDKIFAETGVVMPDELKNTGVATKIAFLEKSVKFLTSEQKTRTAAALATEAATAKVAAAATLAGLNNTSREAVATTNATVKKDVAAANNTAKYGDTPTTAAPAAAVVTTQTPSQKLGITPATKAAVVAAPPPAEIQALTQALTNVSKEFDKDKALTPGAQARDELQKKAVEQSAKVAALAPPAYNTSQPNALLVWRASKALQYEKEKAILAAINQQLAQTK